jgi:hypothetical protein
MASGPAVARLVSEALSRGVFQAIADRGPLFVSEIAAHMHVPEHSAAVLMDGLVMSDWALAYPDGRFGNVASVTHHLVNGLPAADDLRPIVALFTSENLVSRYARLGAALEAGGATDSETGDAMFDHPWWTFFSRVTGPMASTAAAALLSSTPEAFPDSAAILDVAAGSGVYGFTLAAKR